MFPDVKVGQAALLCSSIAAFLQRQGMAPGQVPLVVGGDFNSIWQKYSSDQWDQVGVIMSLGTAVLCAVLFCPLLLSSTAATTGAICRVTALDAICGLMLLGFLL
jgi:hypothetical protein